MSRLLILKNGVNKNLIAKEFNIHTLKNGIRIVHKPFNSPVSHCGLIVNTGSRDEVLAEHGMAHFIEHAIFKGTKKRKSFHILTRLDEVGGDLNAFTTKEDICVHGSFLNEYYERCIELISDMFFNATFEQKELEKEKEVIIDEINSYKDAPAELIFDDFEELVFANHSLGRSVLGTPESINNFKRMQLVKFVKKNFNTHKIVFCSYGNIEFSEIIKLAEKYLDVIPANTNELKRKPFKTYRAVDKIVQKNVYQTHCILGGPSGNIHGKNKTALILLNNILGGPTMNSKLSMVVREQYGYCYSIESNYTPYTDTGLFSVYFSCDKEYFEKTINLVHREMKKICTTKISPNHLKKAKRQLIGQIAVAQQNSLNDMLAIGKSLLVYNRVDTFENLCKKIEGITEDQIMEVSIDMFDRKRLSMLVYESE